MQTRPINAPAALVPTSGYAQAFEATGYTRMLCISGQTPTDTDGKAPEGFGAQCRLAWKNVAAQLEAAGMTLDNLVLHRTFLADRKYTMQNRAGRQSVLAGRTPACTVIICDLFDEAWLIEIEATAVA